MCTKPQEHSPNLRNLPIVCAHLCLGTSNETWIISSEMRGETLLPAPHGEVGRGANEKSWKCIKDDIRIIQSDECRKYFPNEWFQQWPQEISTFFLHFNSTHFQLSHTMLVTSHHIPSAVLNLIPPHRADCAQSWELWLTFQLRQIRWKNLRVVSRCMWLIINTEIVINYDVDSERYNGAKWASPRQL